MSHNHQHTPARRINWPILRIPAGLLELQLLVWLAMSGRITSEGLPFGYIFVASQGIFLVGVSLATGWVLWAKSRSK